MDYIALADTAASALFVRHKGCSTMLRLAIISLLLAILIDQFAIHDRYGNAAWAAGSQIISKYRVRG